VTFPPIKLLEGLQIVRLRPHLFVEEVTVENLLRRVVRDIAESSRRSNISSKRAPEASSH
jgi:hypothetical protein